jgi:hypothetical protein
MALSILSTSSKGSGGNRHIALIFFSGRGDVGDRPRKLVYFMYLFSFLYYNIIRLKLVNVLLGWVRKSRTVIDDRLAFIPCEY